MINKVQVSWKVVHEKDYQSNATKTIDFKRKPQLVTEKKSVATGANENLGERKINNKQSRQVTVYRKIKLVHSPSDPLTEDFKRRIEKVTRISFPVRVAMHLREYAAFRNQKLVIELLPSDKITLSEEDQNKKIQTLTEQNKALLQKFELMDNEVGLPEKLKTLAWQCWMYGRNLLIILYDNDDNSKIKNLFQINSRRLGEPIMDEENDLSFEGCIVDGNGLDKESMIYAVYQDRELSPYTENYGYSIVETVLREAETHGFMIENMKEIALSAWLPTILMKIDTGELQSTGINTKISNILASIEPGKLVAVPPEVEEAEMLDMKPNFEGINSTLDSFETKIYNSFHAPLFMVKSDEIANRATANKSAKIFFEGVVTDDQKWMENLLGIQWYDPILKEELSRTGLEKTGKIPNVDVIEESGLPFLIRRKFEIPAVEDFLDLAQALVELKTNNIWDTTKVNEVLKTEEVTSRVQAQEKIQRKQDQEKLQFEMALQQKANDSKIKNESKVAVASLRERNSNAKLLQKIEEKLSAI